MNTLKKAPLCITPFNNEEEVIHIGELDIENRTDEILLHGALTITKDKQGIKNALCLARQINAIVDALLSCEKLPSKIKKLPTNDANNPFEKPNTE